MSGSEDDTYSTVFASLKHPIRRKILRTLSAEPESFSNLLKMFDIESSHLTYHLEGLGNLLVKTEDGKYALSSLGKAAISMMTQVEEAPKAPTHTKFSHKPWRFLTIALLVGVILLSTFSYLEHQHLIQLSTQYSKLEAEHAALQKVLAKAFDVGDAFLTDEYSVNDSIKTVFPPEVNISDTTGVNETIILLSFGPPRMLNICHIYNLINNSALEIEISLSTLDHPQAYLSLAVCVEELKNISGVVAYYTEPSDSPTNECISFQVLFYHPIWDTKVANSSKYVLPLLSRGWYVIQIEPPRVQNETESYTIDYKLTLQTKDQGDSIPFFVRSARRDHYYYQIFSLTSSLDDP